MTMHSFYRATTRHPKTMVLLFALLAAACALCKPLIAVNYDMNDYLPPDTASTLALDAMDAEYDGGVPNARVMVKNVSVPEALAYKEKLEAIDGVTGVTWLDERRTCSSRWKRWIRIPCPAIIRMASRCFQSRSRRISASQPWMQFER